MGHDCAQHKQRRPCRDDARFCLGVVLGILLALGIGCGTPDSLPVPLPELSKYAIALEAPFNTPTHYDLAQPTDLARYRPVADWVGRLILPSLEQLQAESEFSDWVWVEIYQAPPTSQSLIGQTLRLTWELTPERQAYLDSVTRGVRFSTAAIANQDKGNVHPQRVDGWPQVGPLQSLAGARPRDDLIVALSDVTVAEATQLEIETAPIQVPAPLYALVDILGPDGVDADSSVAMRAERCPTDVPCVNERFRVRHYNPDSGQFDGIEAVIRIPQVVPDLAERFQSTPAQLESSSAGEAGWYVYGAYDHDGLFVVRAIAPRSLFLLDPQTTVLGDTPSLNYINFLNWRNTPARKGTLQTVWLHPHGDTLDTPLGQVTEGQVTEGQVTEGLVAEGLVAEGLVTEGQVTDWQVGDRALVMHIFGGVGGEKGETKAMPGTITGHFAYGVAEVIVDPFTQHPRFDITYNQIYAHNSDGIVAGRVSWAEYMGNLQRGWLGLRPVSDAVVKLDALNQDYQFGDIMLSPMTELQHRLEIMMARYRIGDGLGAAIVKPAQSCIQDSSQAVIDTILQLERQVEATPAIGRWLQTYPDDPQTQRFAQLLDLKRTLVKTLVPLGVLRPDWQKNSEVLAGIRQDRALGNQANWLTSLLSWRTVMPRVAYDELANGFLRQGAQLWILRTNQVGGG